MAKLPPGASKKEIEAREVKIHETIARLAGKKKMRKVEMTVFIQIDVTDDTVDIDDLTIDFDLANNLIY